MVSYALADWAQHKAKNLGLARRELTVLLLLANMGDNAFICFPSWRYIEERTGYSKSSVGDALKVLEREGVVFRYHQFRKNGGKSTNLYFVNRPGLSREEGELLLEQLSPHVGDRELCEQIVGVFLRERGCSLQELSQKALGFLIPEDSSVHAAGMVHDALQSIAVKLRQELPPGKVDRFAKDMSRILVGAGLIPEEFGPAEGVDSGGGVDGVCVGEDEEVGVRDRVVFEAERGAFEAERAAFEAERAVFEAKLAAVEAERSTFEAERAVFEAERAELEAKLAAVEAERPVFERKNALLQGKLEGFENRFEGEGVQPVEQTGTGTGKEQPVTASIQPAAASTQPVEQTGTGTGRERPVAASVRAQNPFSRGSHSGTEVSVGNLLGAFLKRIEPASEDTVEDIASGEKSEDMGENKGVKPVENSVENPVENLCISAETEPKDKNFFPKTAQGLSEKSTTLLQKLEYPCPETGDLSNKNSNPNMKIQEKKKFIYPLTLDKGVGKREKPRRNSSRIISPLPAFPPNPEQNWFRTPEEGYLQQQLAKIHPKLELPKLRKLINLRADIDLVATVRTAFHRIKADRVYAPNAYLVKCVFKDPDLVQKGPAHLALSCHEGFHHWCPAFRFTKSVSRKDSVEWVRDWYCPDCNVFYGRLLRRPYEEEEVIRNIAAHLDLLFVQCEHYVEQLCRMGKFDAVNIRDMGHFFTNVVEHNPGLAETFYPMFTQYVREQCEASVSFPTSQQVGV